jgi:hypothetical protein
MRTKLIAALPALLLAACLAEATGPEPYPYPAYRLVSADTVHLAVGESGVAGSTGIRVELREVVSDSRCPINALCVWPGDAHVRLGVRTGSGSWSDVNLHTYLHPHSVRYGQYIIRLVLVAPPRVADEEVKLSDYRVSVAVGY